MEMLAVFIIFLLLCFVIVLCVALADTVKRADILESTLRNKMEEKDDKFE